MKQIEVVLKQNISYFGILIVLIPVFFLIAILSVFNFFYVFLSFVFLPLFLINTEYIIDKKCQMFFAVRISKFRIYKKKKTIFFPDYISLMNQSYKEEGGWMWFPAVFGQVKYKHYTIKFFKETKRQTVFKTTNKEEAILKTNELSELFNVRIHNALKHSST